MTRIIDDKEKALRLKTGFRYKQMFGMSYSSEKSEYVYKGEVKNLSQVLLALEYKIQKTFNISCNEITFLYIDEDLGISELFWDLTKESLEEQSEETQRRINELLNNK